MRDFKVFQVGVFVLEVCLVGQGSVVLLDWGWVVVLAVFVYDADAIGCGRHNVVCRIRRTLHSLMDFLGALAASREKLHALDYAAKTVCRGCHGQLKDKRRHNKHDEHFSDSCSHNAEFIYFLPNNVFQIALPIFRSTPAFDVGMPVALAIFCLICVMPKARFHEKLSPGIGVDFFVMIDCSSLYMLMDSR